MRALQTILVLGLIATASAVVVQFPDIKRYMKMRSMT
jgi:hypothetical protein